LNFVYRRLNSQLSLVNFVTRHGILVGQMNSEFDRNVINCSLRYNTAVDSRPIVLANWNVSPNNIDKYAIATHDDQNTMHCFAARTSTTPIRLIGPTVYLMIFLVPHI
jgi:hypothetical protein